MSSRPVRETKELFQIVRDAVALRVAGSTPAVPWALDELERRFDALREARPSAFDVRLQRVEEDVSKLTEAYRAHTHRMSDGAIDAPADTGTKAEVAGFYVQNDLLANAGAKP